MTYGYVFKTFSPKWDVFHKPLPLGLKELCRRECWMRDHKSQKRWVTPRRQCLPDTIGPMHIWALGDGDSVYKDWPGPSQIGTQRWEREVDFHPYLKSSLQLPSTWKGKISLFQWSLTGYVNHTSGEAPSPEVFDQYKMNSMVFFVSLWTF